MEVLSVSGTAEWKCEEFDRLLGGEEPRRYGLGVRVGPKLRRLILRSDAVTPKLNYGTWARNGVSRVETPDQLSSFIPPQKLYFGLIMAEDPGGLCTRYTKCYSTGYFLKIELTTSAICRANNGGTAFPTWWYC
jgi:hypothetical protein